MRLHAACRPVLNSRLGSSERFGRALGRLLCHLMKGMSSGRRRQPLVRTLTASSWIACCTEGQPHGSVRVTWAVYTVIRPLREVDVDIQQINANHRLQI